MNCDSDDLLQVCDTLLNADKVTEAHTGRAVSTAYYAVFHHVCCSSANLLIGGDDTFLTRAKTHMRRSIQHTELKGRMQHAHKAGKDLNFPDKLVSFANTFCELQKDRHNADYDPLNQFSKADALAKVEGAKTAIRDFDSVDEKDRRAFLVWMLLERPKKRA